MRRGRPYNRPIASAQKLATQLHAALFRLTDGRLGGEMLRSPVLILTTTGRRSKKKRETPLLYLRDGEDFAIVASNGGTSKHPAWYLNLMADPEAEVRMRGRALRVRAEEVSGEEKRRLWGLLVEMYPSYADYQEKTNREIPVLVLRPVD